MEAVCQNLVFFAVLRYEVNDVICEIKMAAEGVAKVMKEEEDKVENAEDMDVDSIDEKTAAE